MAIDYLITSNRSVITWKKSFITIIQSIKLNQVINQISNIWLLNVKVLTMIKV